MDFRIELERLARIYRHSGVKDAVVIARQDDRAEKVLVAYVTPHNQASDKQGTASTPEGALAREYRCHGSLAILTHFPLTPSGKLNENALPAPGARVACRRSVRNHLSAASRRAWRRCGNLFWQWSRLAGTTISLIWADHSLLATRVISQVWESLGLDISLRALFELPTVKQFAAHVAAWIGAAR